MGWKFWEVYPPGCGYLDIDLRVRLAAAPQPALAASGNLGFCPPWDWGRKIWFSNGMADERSNISVRKYQVGFHTNFSRCSFPYYTRSSGLRFARPSLHPRTDRESRNSSWIQELIVNLGTHRESRNPSWIQEPILNPRTHRESKNPSWIPSVAKDLMPRDLMSLGIKSSAFLNLTWT